MDGKVNRALIYHAGRRFSVLTLFKAGLCFDYSGIALFKHMGGTFSDYRPNYNIYGRYRKIVGFL